MSLFGKTFELSLARNYVSSWGVPEAVRELIQNAIDSSAPFEYEWEVEDDGLHTLSIVSRGVTLQRETLLLGSSTKADNPDAIGSFGEGFKLALLVLVRENKAPAVYNGPVMWSPYFEKSRSFDAEVLKIEERPAVEKSRDLTFTVSALTDEERDQIVGSCRQMQRIIGEVLTTSRGQILLHESLKGRLYVGGLFICKTDLLHGYDVKPALINLERDRKTVDGFDLKWLVKDMWFETERYEQIAAMISEEAPDMAHADYGTPQLVKEACYRLFKESHPGKLVATTQAELKTMVAQGMTRTVYVGSTYGGIIRGSIGYSSDAGRRGGKPALPHERLAEWYHDAKRHMHADARRTFEPILEEAKRWTVK